MPIGKTASRGVRRVAAAAGALALGTVLSLAGGAPARAADEIWIEVNPSTIEPGYLVGIRGWCGADRAEKSAPMVSSTVFGEVPLKPQDDPHLKFLSTTVTIPTGAEPETYSVRMVCPSRDTAEATLHIVAPNHSTRGPDTGFGGLAGGADGPPLMLTGGLAAVTAGAALGLFALWRRRAGEAA